MKNNFKYLLGFSALMVSACSAYFSVFGLSQLFSGSKIAVIIMASILEVGKIITATALHKYWKELAYGLKYYLSICVIVLMVITSAGIYGFLTDSYQKTANKFEIHENELSILDSKKIMFEKNISDNERIVSTNNKRIDQLTNIRNIQENRLDSAKTNKTKDKVRNDISIATNEIQKLSNDISSIYVKNGILSDSINHYNIKSLNLKSGSEVASEVGPLKYIAELTGIGINKVVNYLILLLIFVFDPLAIALILITNKVFSIDSKSNNERIKENPKEELKEEPKKELKEELKKEPKEELPAIQYVTDENGEFKAVEIPITENYVVAEEREKAKKVILDDIKLQGIEYNASYLKFLEVLFKDGNIKIGEALPNYNKFLEEIKASKIKYVEKEVKDFLTVCNLFKITDMSGPEKKIAKDYVVAKEIILLLSK